MKHSLKERKRERERKKECKQLKQSVISYVMAALYIGGTGADKTDALKTGSALWKKYSVTGGENLNGIPASNQRTTLQTKPGNSF